MSYKAAISIAQEWDSYSRTATCARRHEVTHAICMAACWRRKAASLKQRRRHAA